MEGNDAGRFIVLRPFSKNELLLYKAECSYQPTDLYVCEQED